MKLIFQELEQIEENWKQESRDLVAMVTRLQDENTRLSNALQESRGDNESSSQQGIKHDLNVNKIVVLRCECVNPKWYVVFSIYLTAGS